jgi:hypothetical protein
MLFLSISSQHAVRVCYFILLCCVQQEVELQNLNVHSRKIIWVTYAVEKVRMREKEEISFIKLGRTNNNDAINFSPHLSSLTNE